MPVHGAQFGPVQIARRLVIFPQPYREPMLAQSQARSHWYIGPDVADPELVRIAKILHHPLPSEAVEVLGHVIALNGYVNFWMISGKRKPAGDGRSSTDEFLYELIVSYEEIFRSTAAVCDTYINAYSQICVDLFEGRHGNGEEIYSIFIHDIKKIDEKVCAIRRYMAMIDGSEQNMKRTFNISQPMIELKYFRIGITPDEMPRRIGC